MSKALPGNNKTFHDVMIMTFLYSSYILGSVQVKKIVENRNFVVFYRICFKFGIGSTFVMLITIRRPKLKLKNDLSKKIAIFYQF